MKCDKCDKIIDGDYLVTSNGTFCNQCLNDNSDNGDCDDCLTRDDCYYCV